MTEFYNLYPARETRGSSPRMYSPADDGNYFVRQGQSGKDVGNYSTSHGVRTWRILAQVITLFLLLLAACHTWRTQPM